MINSEDIDACLMGDNFIRIGKLDSRGRLQKVHHARGLGYMETGRANGTQSPAEEV